MSIEGQVTTQTVILDAAGVLGPASITLTVNAQYVRIASVLYRSLTALPNMAALPTFRDADSGSIMPLRAGSELRYENRLVERVELAVPASTICVVDLEFGDGNGRAAPMPVLSMPHLQSATGVSSQFIVGATNAAGMYIGPDSLNIGVWVPPGQTVRFTGRPTLYYYGTVADRFNVTSVRPLEPAGSL